MGPNEDFYGLRAAGIEAVREDAHAQRPMTVNDQDGTGSYYASEILVALAEVGVRSMLPPKTDD